MSDIYGFDDDELEDGNDAQGQLNTESNEGQDNRIPAWSVDIKYKNGTEQSVKGYGHVPNPVVCVFLDFEDYFEDVFSNGNCADDVE